MFDSHHFISARAHIRAHIYTHTHTATTVDMYVFDKMDIARYEIITRIFAFALLLLLF